MILKNRRVIVFAVFFLAAVVLLSAMLEGGTTYAAAVKKPAKVKISSVKASGLKITLKWKKAKNAKKYQIYQKTGSGKWRLRKTLKSRMLAVKGAYGKTYQFKVRGVNGKKKGSFSTVKKVSIPKKHDDPEIPEKTEAEKSADAVMEMIRALPDFDVIGIEDSDAVDDVRTAYNALSDKAKALVDPEILKKLSSLEQTIADLIEEQERTDQENREAANAVSRKIMALYELLNEDLLELKHAKQVRAVRTEYEALTDAQKVFVSKEATLSVLEMVEAKIAEYYEMVRAAFVKWDKVTIGGLDFFKVTEDDGKTLLLACDVVRDDDEEPLLMEYGESSIWRDSYLREYLNGAYLEAHPEINEIALQTDLKTRGTTVADGTTYIETSDRVFLMTMTDIIGSQYGFPDHTAPDDFTYNGSFLPGLENGEVMLDDEEIVFWGRDEYLGASGIVPYMNMYLTTYYLAPGARMTYNGWSPSQHNKAALLPAFWVETDRLPEGGDLND